MASPDTYAVVARRLGVRYDLRLRYDQTLRRAAAEWLRHPRSRGRSAFWALEDVTFALRRGEILGVVGPNGAGKSTLLLALAGILRPDAGTVYTEGRPPTLLTLGAGFEPDLSGRENIYLSAAYHGFSQRETERRLHEIVEFADLGRFMDAPVRQYSTGMRARLAFAVAVHTEPDVLLLDEVLGVGDAAFQQKCKAKLGELMANARAIVVVTHSMAFVRQTCTKGLWLQAGRAAAWGDAAETVDRYLAETGQPPGAGQLRSVGAGPR